MNKFTDKQRIAIIEITKGDYWYACDRHRLDYIEEFTLKPLLATCGSCGDRATHFGPNPLNLEHKSPT